VGFYRKLSQREGVNYRLPTEAEWEYACRAGAKTIFYWGNDFDGSYAWYYENSGIQTQPVGEKRPNALGLYDMSGNVWEWCQDWYGEYYYGSSPLRDPQGPSSGAYRVVRGGSWLNPPEGLRSSRRSYCYPDPDVYYGPDVGFLSSGM